jgi:hypothetical protein
MQPSLTVSLSETFAFLTGKTQEERILKFNFLKRMYNSRSKIVHTGQAEVTSNGYDHLYKELKNGIYIILDLIEENKWKSIDDLYGYVEKLKFA